MAKIALVYKPLLDVMLWKKNQIWGANRTSASSLRPIGDCFTITPCQVVFINYVIFNLQDVHKATGNKQTITYKKKNAKDKGNSAIFSTCTCYCLYYYKNWVIMS